VRSPGGGREKGGKGSKRKKTKNDTGHRGVMGKGGGMGEFSARKMEGRERKKKEA